MGTNIKKKKDFDAIELQHKLRIKLKKRVQGMSAEEEIRYFKEIAEKARKRRARS